MDFFCDKKHLMKLFGDNLRRARMKRSITQEVLSGKADLNIRSLQRMEAGEMNILITTFVRLKQVLGCSWDELIANPQSGAEKTSGVKTPRH